MANITLARKYWDKAFDYYFKGKSDRAIAAGRKAMELNPGYVRPHWIVGYAFLHRETPDRESAIKEFRQLVEKDPRWCEGHTALGGVLAKQGRIIEAMKCYREALRLKPKQPGLRIELARLLLKRNDYREAISVLRGIDSPFRTEIDAYHLLARAIEERGCKPEDMRPMWERILTFDESIPANRAAIAEARQQLEKMGPVSESEI
ncbi:MAG TPA: tetratricopeptide repeat protein [Pyrinomonadaceae bacterium]|jgi:tetratricopeptide (TPR) repeat protein|nr:tetratricopeptide repeat protein [Pyrinomonadaceae bacterium]